MLAEEGCISVAAAEGRMDIDDDEAGGGEVGEWNTGSNG